MIASVAFTLGERAKNTAKISEKETKRSYCTFRHEASETETL